MPRTGMKKLLNKMQDPTDIRNMEDPKSAEFWKALQASFDKNRANVEQIRTGKRRMRLGDVSGRPVDNTPVEIEEEEVIVSTNGR